MLLVLFVMMGGYFATAQQINLDQAASIFRNSEAGFPEFVRLNTNYELKIEEFPAFLREILKLRPADAFRLVRTETDQLGWKHYRYQQYYNGVPVQYGIYKAHTQNGRVITLNGDYYRVPEGQIVSLTETEALGAAMQAMDANVYKWDLPVEEAWLALREGNPFATFFPQGEIVYVKNTGGFHAAPYRLAYKFDIYAHEPVARADIFIDAQTGDVIFRNDKIQTSDALGIATTAYSGNQAIVTDSTGQTFRLRETGRANGVETYDMREGQNYGNAVDFEDADNLWNNVNSAQDEVATDAHWGAEMTFDYYMQIHGRNSYDNAGSILLSYVHYGQGYANAFWNGSQMTYGDGSGGFQPLTSLDIVGHEFSHGVTGNSAGLVYMNEPGALNESFSDIFGASIEAFARPTNANWRIGEDISGAGLRNMANPSAFNDPDTYLGSNWYSGGADNGGVHTNSGVQNYWFYLLSDGGSGTNDNGDPFSVIGLGIDTAALIAYRNLNVYLGAMSNYHDARFYAVQSAIDLFGECSNPMIQTMNAWQAVGVGAAYTGNLLAAYTTNDTSSCQVPFSASFTDYSTSAIGYLWDFGDGNTSTAVNPTHIYTNLGVYDVTLIVKGCNNTFDTLFFPGRVVLDDNLTCTVNMGTNGTFLNTGCVGELYDSGGAGNYLNNVFSTLTIDPGSSPITLSFQSFNFAAGDRIIIYDGPSDSSAVIGQYAGMNSPGVITSTGSALTIREMTNGFNTRAGFHATWSCLVGNEAPKSSFQFEAFPNPAQDQLVVQVKADLNAEIELKLMDMFGKVIHKQVFASTDHLQEKLNLEELAAGIYLLQIRMNEGMQVKKIRVQ